jgi:hypothetical protein
MRVPDQKRGDVMSSGIISKKLLVGCGLGGAALLSMLAMDGLAEAGGPSAAASRQAPASSDPALTPDQQPSERSPAGAPRLGVAQQALAGLAGIRQQQCQSGNQLACQALPQMPAIQQQLTQLDQDCRSGDRKACGEFETLALRISTAYSESAAVMQAGEAGMARMNAWRAQMNANAATSMANLRAQGAAGQAAHNARQEANAAMTRSWEAGQASSDRTQGRYIDSIYGGTTMDGGGVQARVPYGTTGYTDGHSNVVAVPQGDRAPDGWQEMDPTYAAPQ